MSESEIKIQLLRLIEEQKGERLKEIYDIIIKKLYQKDSTPNPLSSLEQSYREMACDKQREKEAFEWIEGTLYSSGL